MMGLVACLTGLQLAAALSVSGHVKRGEEPVVNAAVTLTSVEPSRTVLVPDLVLIDQRNLRFEPRVVVITPGSTVEFANSDSLLHNVFSPGGGSGGFDLGTYPMGEKRARTFPREGINVILCHVHPEMVAYVVVAPTPYRSVTSANGAYRIPEVPAGTYRVHVSLRRRVMDAGLFTVSGSRQVFDIDLSRLGPGVTP